MRTVTPAPIRFWAKVEKTETCWLWTASKHPDGYGSFGLTRRVNYKAHRFAYEQVKGQIPEGMVIDHLCRVRHCVNPDHLEAVPNRVNVLRGEGIAARRGRMTTCALGHEFATRKNGTRICIPCRNARARARYHERRAEAAE